MLKFCDVINCIFVHSPKKLTLGGDQDLSSFYFYQPYFETYMFDAGVRFDAVLFCQEFWQPRVIWFIVESAKVF